LLIDHWRSQKVEYAIDQVDQISSQTVSPEKMVEKRENAHQISKAIQSLDESSQMVISCRFIADMGHREIAHALGISEGHVRVLQYRALKKLKNILGENNE